MCHTGFGLHRKSRFLSSVFVCLLGLLLGTPLWAQSADELVASARSSFLKGKLDDAAKDYRKAAEARPELAKAHVGLIRTLLEMHNLPQAETALAGAERMFPGSAEMKTLRGDLLYRGASFQDAFRTYQEVIQADAKQAQAYHGLAHIYLLERMNHTARLFIAEAHKLDPDDPEILLDWAATRSERKEEIAAVEKYLALIPDGPPELLKLLKAQVERLRALGERKTFVVRDASKSYAIKLGWLRVSSREPYGIYIRMSVNGSKPLKVQLDTGASGILLNADAAEKAGVQRLADAAFGGIGDQGPRSGYSAWADSVRFGDLEIQGCVVNVLGKRGLRDMDGLIGTDVFARFLVRLDSPRDVLELTPLPGVGKSPEGFWDHDRTFPPEEAGFFSVRVQGHLLFVEGVLNGKKKGLFAIDSGSSYNFVSHRVARELTMTADGPHWIVRGLSGSVQEVWTAARMSVRVANLLQEHTDWLAWDQQNLSRSTGFEFTGAIGMTILKQVALVIDYRNGLVRFIPQGR